MIFLLEHTEVNCEQRNGQDLTEHFTVIKLTEISQLKTTRHALRLKTYRYMQYITNLGEKAREAIGKMENIFKVTILKW